MVIVNVHDAGGNEEGLVAVPQPAHTPIAVANRIVPIHVLAVTVF